MKADEIIMLLKKPDLLSFLKFSTLSTVSGIISYKLMNPVEKYRVNERNVVITTGCDSGLGYNIAIHCHNKLNMSIVACVLQKEGKGANKLKELFKDSGRFHLVELDVTKNGSINEAKKYVEDLLNTNKQYQLTALVNNAGVMIFGESEWQTNEMVEQQVNVNLIGTIKMTNAFLPLVRQHKARIINVASHCAIQCLPTLSIYGATKSGVTSYTECLRMEMKKYGVDVVNFIPGSFFGNSNLIASQLKYASTMKQTFNKEQLDFYEDYLDRLNMHLSAIAVEREPQLLQDQRIMETFEDALLQLSPSPVYKSEPMRYKIYHFLFSIMPLPLHDWLVGKFASLPSYTPRNAIASN